MTTIALENVLTKAGLNVKPSEFLALVEDAARRLKPPNPEPAHYLSPEQRAALEDVGLDLSPQSEDERDYRARTVAAHTVLAESALTVGEAAALLGVVIWGVGVGTHESIMRAAIAPMVAAGRRATAYGIFNTGYGLFWFAGSVVMGVLYDTSIPWLIAFSLVMQLASLPLLIAIRKYR